jgi:hypothetical protein
MTTIKKTIQNLKPGKQYLLTVKPKDVELNVVLDPASAIRFTIPSDLTQPADLGNLTIVGNYKSIMISFNPSNESDLRGYNYEVYLPEDIAQSGSTYVIISGSTPYLSGFSASNVITVDVPQNSERTNQVDANTGVTTPVTTPKIYFARVQSIDTSANKSAWTPIVASTATTFIESAHIIDLTASKITAGTIGAHTITMAGGTSVIKSSTFDGDDVGGGSYANATTGWLINGSGRAYFYDATIAGSIDIGGYDSGSFHVDSDGNLWSGSGTLVNAPFKVSKEGDVTANTITTKNLTLTGSTVMSSNSKIFLGTGVYNNTNTPFYVDSSNQFSLGNKLTWNGSSLSIDGSVTIGGTAGNDLITGEEVNANVTSITGNVITTGRVQSSGGSSYLDIDNGTFALGNKLTWNGTTLAISGNVTATSGSIGGILIEATKISKDWSWTGAGDDSSATGIEINSNGVAKFTQVSAPRVGLEQELGAYLTFGNQIRVVISNATTNPTGVFTVRNIRYSTDEPTVNNSQLKAGDIWLS